MGEMGVHSGAGGRASGAEGLGSRPTISGWRPPASGSRVLMIGGGGTGGHIYPAIAIAQEFVARGADRRVVFVGTPYGLEKTIVPKAGFPLEFISVGGLKGKGPFDFIKNLFRLPFGFLQAWSLVGKYRPSVALGVGGYSSGPVLLAARLRGIPTAIHYPMPLHRQTAYRGYPVAGNGLPVSDKLAAEVLSLPMHPYLAEREQDRVVAAIKAEL